MRRFGLHCVAATFGNCDVSMVAGVLNVKEGEVAGMLGEGWSIEGSTVKVPPSSSNTAHATGAVRVTLSTDSITRIIAAQ